MRRPHRLAIPLILAALALVTASSLRADSTRLEISQTSMVARAHDYSKADSKAAFCDRRHPLNCARAISYWKRLDRRDAAAALWQKHARIRLAAPTVQYAIRLACASQPTLDCAWFKRMLGCESHLDPLAANAHSTAQGLAQFLDSTWNGNLFARFPRTDPIASALGAAWYAVRDGHAPWASSEGCWS